MAPLIKPAVESGLGVAATSLIAPGSLGSEGDVAGASQTAADTSFYVAQAIHQAENGIHSMSPITELDLKF